MVALMCLKDEAADVTNALEKKEPSEKVKRLMSWSDLDGTSASLATNKQIFTFTPPRQTAKLVLRYPKMP
jgi:hypothetical protein